MNALALVDKTTSQIHVIWYAWGNCGEGASCLGETIAVFNGLSFIQELRG